MPTSTPYTSVFGVKPLAVPAVESTQKTYVPLQPSVAVGDQFTRSKPAFFSAASLRAQFDQFKLSARKNRTHSSPVSITYAFQQNDEASLSQPRYVAMRVLNKKNKPSRSAHGTGNGAGKGTGKPYFVADVVGYDPVDFGKNLTLGSSQRSQLPELETQSIPRLPNAYAFEQSGRIALAKELSVETTHSPLAQKIVNGLRQATEFLKPLKPFVSVAADDTVTVMGRSFNPVHQHIDTETGASLKPMRLMRFGGRVIQMQELSDKGLTGRVLRSAKEAMAQLTEWTAELEQKWAYNRVSDQTRLFEPATVSSKPIKTVSVATAKVLKKSLPQGVSILGGLDPEVLNALSVKKANPFARVALSDGDQTVASMPDVFLAD